jgi:cobalamin biosynthesis protein CobD/CbiB
MLGLLHKYSSQYLYVLAIGTILFFGTPLLITPIRWAKLMKWEIPTSTDLTVYFGRCLGGVICVMACFAILATNSILTQQYFFNFIISTFTVMTFIHIYGWIKKIQPFTETLEIFYWIALIVSSLLFYPQ